MPEPTLLRAAPLSVLAAITFPAAGMFSFTQLTDTPFGFGMFEPSVSDDGRRIAFSAGYDFTGENPDGNFEIYLHDADAGIVQLTDTPFGFGHFTPLITADGSNVVFRTTYNHTGENPDFSFELFAVDVATREVAQVTHNPGGVGVFEPKLSGDGNMLVYRSNGNPIGTNADLNFEVFCLEIDSGAILQATFTTVGASFTPDINHDGSRVIFRAAHNFDGSNPEGNFEIWRWESGRGVSAVTVTPAGELSECPALDGSGDRIAFLSRFDFTGENPDATQEVYIADMREPMVTYRQATVPGLLLHLEPVMSPTGTYVIFESMRDPLGENPDTNREVFLYNLETSLLSQLTHTTRGASIPQLSERASTYYADICAGGEMFVLRNEHELDGPNPGTNLELFAAHVISTGDLDDDGDVDFGDLLILLAAWGACPDGSPCFADLDNSDGVGFGDLLILLANWS